MEFLQLRFFFNLPINLLYFFIFFSSHGKFFFFFIFCTLVAYVCFFSGRPSFLLRNLLYQILTHVIYGLISFHFIFSLWPNLKDGKHLSNVSSKKWNRNFKQIRQLYSFVFSLALLSIRFLCTFLTFWLIENSISIDDKQSGIFIIRGEACVKP